MMLVVCEARSKTRDQRRGTKTHLTQLGEHGKARQSKGGWSKHLTQLGEQSNVRGDKGVDQNTVSRAKANGTKPCQSKAV